MNEEREIIYFRESLLQSILSDIFTFGTLIGSVLFNYKFCGNSYFLNGVILVVLLAIAWSKHLNMRQVFHNKQELIDYLTKENK